MITEGIGQVAPQQVPIRMTQNELFNVYHLSKERADFRQYKNRNNAWSQGCKGSMMIPGIGELTPDVRPIFVGTLGEYAAKRYLNSGRFNCRVELDTSLNQAGDYGVDLQSNGLKIQVKTRQSEQFSTLVKRTSYGRLLSIPVHAFLFCEWTGGSVVSLLGWCPGDVVGKKPLVDSFNCQWHNAVIDDVDLKPIDRLKDEIEAWKLAWQEANKCL